MSRGGWRGGRGGGGLGRGRGDGSTGFLPWEQDSDIKPDYTPSELFPTYKPLPVPAPSNKREYAQIEAYRSFRAAMRDGPLYAVISDQNQDKSKSGGLATGTDPFEGVQTYSKRYKKPSRVAPRLSGRPFVKEFFPSELHDTIDPPKDHSKKKLSLAIQGARPNAPVDIESLEEAGDVTEGGLNDDKEEEDKEEEQPGEAEEEEMDSDFEEDEEEMGEDYNAEGYFSPGDEDFADDDGGDNEAYY